MVQHNTVYSGYNVPPRDRRFSTLLPSVRYKQSYKENTYVENNHLFSNMHTPLIQIIMSKTKQKQINYRMYQMNK